MRITYVLDHLKMEVVFFSIKFPFVDNYENFSGKTRELGTVKRWTGFDCPDWAICGRGRRSGWKVRGVNWYDRKLVLL